MVFYAFDLLHLDGFDTRAAPLIERKRALQAFLTEASASAPRVMYSEHLEDGAALYARAPAPDTDGRLLPMIKNMAGYARGSGEINHADNEKILSTIEQAVSNGSYLALAPQFVVTATR